MFNIKKKKKEMFNKSRTGARGDVGGNGGDVVDDSGMGGTGGQDYVAGLGNAADKKGAKKEKQKKKMMKVQQQNCSKASTYILNLGSNQFHSQVPALMARVEC